MAYPAYLRERARQLRVEKRLSLDEIADRLALPKTTVYYWIRDLPLGRARNWSVGQQKGTAAMQARCRRLRGEAYARGLEEYDELINLPTFRDFVALYIAEGSKRDRNRVSIANSDERIVAMAASWFRSLTSKLLTYSVQYHADQNLKKLRQFWASVLGIDPSVIVLLRKSNSGELNGRRWRSANGVMSIRVNDTYLRSRLQAWIDRIRAEWGLDSAPHTGRGATW
jgi:AcrR family transcriptional regulator